MMGFVLLYAALMVAMNVKLHDEDQFISAAASGWATWALLLIQKNTVPPWRNQR